MSLTFYYSPNSTASLTELVLEELAVPCEKVLLDIRKGETKTPEFLAINPNGCVPCIVHDATAIWESVALTLYLGETFGVERGLYPAAGPERGVAMTWIAWANVTLAEAIGRFMRHTSSWYPADQQNPAAGETAKQDTLKYLGILDRFLAGKDYLLGANYSLADAHLVSLADWIRHFAIDCEPFTHFNGWTARCTARPAYQRLNAPSQG